MSIIKEKVEDVQGTGSTQDLDNLITSFTAENLEPVTTPEEQKRIDLLKRVNLLSVDSTRKVEPRTYALQVFDDIRKETIPLCPLGDISLVSGQAKSKKTFLISSLCSAFIGNETILDAFSTTINEDYKNVLFYDTEQHIGDVIALNNRIKRLSNLDDKTFSERFESVTLREEINPKEVEEMIDVHLEDRFKRKKYGLVILDGVADLMHSTNDEERSFDIVRKLMKWSTLYNCHIISVIHQNKTNKNTRGHLGITMERKGSVLFDLEVNATDTDISTLRFKEVRGLATPKTEISFSINKDGLPYRVDSELVPVVTSGAKAKKDLQDIDFTIIKNLVKNFYDTTSYPNGISKSKLKDELKKQLDKKKYNIEYKTSLGEVDSLIMFLSTKFNLFFKEGTCNQNTRYFLNEDFSNVIE